MCVCDIRPDGDKSAALAVHRDRVTLVGSAAACMMSLGSCEWETLHSLLCAPGRAVQGVQAALSQQQHCQEQTQCSGKTPRETPWDRLPKPLPPSMYGGMGQIYSSPTAVPHQGSTSTGRGSWQNNCAAAQGKAPLLAWPFPQPKEQHRHNVGNADGHRANTGKTPEQSPVRCHKPWGMTSF